MGALLQLMALPAAYMLFAWARHCGASALATALRRIVANPAVRAAPRARLVPRVAVNAVTKAGKEIRAQPSAGALRRGPPKDGRILRNQVPQRVEKMDAAPPRLRRMRARWVIGNLAT